MVIFILFFFVWQTKKSIYFRNSCAREWAIAFNRGLIIDGDNWMNMIESRKKSSHTYNEETAEEIATEIVSKYYKLFREFEIKIESMLSESK